MNDSDDECNGKRECSERSERERECEHERECSEHECERECECDMELELRMMQIHIYDDEGERVIPYVDLTDRSLYHSDEEYQQALRYGSIEFRLPKYHYTPIDEMPANFNQAMTNAFTSHQVKDLKRILAALQGCHYDINGNDGDGNDNDRDTKVCTAIRMLAQRLIAEAIVTNHDPYSEQVNYCTMIYNYLWPTFGSDEMADEIIGIEKYLVTPSS
jgi:hypothetical protein